MGAVSEFKPLVNYGSSCYQAMQRYGENIQVLRTWSNSRVLCLLLLGVSF